MTKTELTVEHRCHDHTFVIEDNGNSAHLDYQLSAGAVHFTHTFVPPLLRGKGLAERLVDTGLRWAAEEDLRVTTSCWFVAKFLP